MAERSKNLPEADDSLIILAVAKGFMEAGLDASDERIRERIIANMVTLARSYPTCGYGQLYQEWINSEARCAEDMDAMPEALRYKFGRL